MSWSPIVARHLDTARPADSSESARRETYPRHVPRDVWAGNPDTDKFWAKGE